MNEKIKEKTLNMEELNKKFDVDCEGNYDSATYILETNLKIIIPLDMEAKMGFYDSQEIYEELQKHLKSIVHKDFVLDDLWILKDKKALKEVENEINGIPLKEPELSNEYILFIKIVDDKIKISELKQLTSYVV